MTEWSVVVVIGVLVSLGVSIVTPIIKLNKAIVELTVTTKSLVETFNKFETNNRDCHQKLWDDQKVQDGKIENHEVRIVRLEEHK